VTASDRTYVVAGCKPWNRTTFDSLLAHRPGRWVFIGSREELTPERLAELDPRFVFFLHWSWKVPAAITDRFECVNFHMTDVPYGRGGSPLQNLIARGHRSSVLSALRMEQELDAGPVYLRAPIDLDGTADAILARASDVAAAMVTRIVEEEPEPVPQSGEVVLFERRTPEQSALGDQQTLDEVHDFIRMLDGVGYPPAFVRVGHLRLEVTRAVRYADRVDADVRITVERDPS